MVTRMYDLFIQFTAHPFGDLVIFFSVAGAAAFALFLWGFSGYILAHEHAGHQTHANASMIWGAAWLVALFVAWEIVRFIAGYFYII